VGGDFGSVDWGFDETPDCIIEEKENDTIQPENR
jgi:hypothetical protein